MKKFEEYLLSIGTYYVTAHHYYLTVKEFVNWAEAHEVPIRTMKRSQFTDYLHWCRERGNGERTIKQKQIAVKRYYFFLKTKNNPAHSWLKKKKETNLPIKALTKEELINIYQSFEPYSPVSYRDRCMLGFAIFQGMVKADLEELRIGDIDFQTGEVFVQGRRRSNSRKLKLEAVQIMHLYDYLQKYRKEFIHNKREQSDRVFLSMGEGKSLGSALNRHLKQLKWKYPQIDDYKHIRASVITHWQKEEGVIEAMVKAGHRYISSTMRYQTSKYEDLQDELKAIHPLEKMKI